MYNVTDKHVDARIGTDTGESLRISRSLESLPLTVVNMLTIPAWSMLTFYVLSVLAMH